MTLQNCWSASVQGASPLQGGSQILYSLWSGLAMLYIYIISIGCYNAWHYPRIFVHYLSLSACICPMPVTTGVYLSTACHYRRIFVECLSLLVYTCPTPVTIGVYLSNACHYRRIFVHCLSLSAYICPMPVTIGVYLSNACQYPCIFCTSLGKRAQCICREPKTLTPKSETLNPKP